MGRPENPRPKGNGKRLYDLKAAHDNVKVYQEPDNAVHSFTLNNTGMAVLIAGLTSLLDHEKEAMTEDERILITKMLGEFRQGLESVRKPLPLQ